MKSQDFFAESESDNFFHLFAHQEYPASTQNRLVINTGHHLQEENIDYYLATTLNQELIDHSPPPQLQIHVNQDPLPPQENINMMIDQPNLMPNPQKTKNICQFLKKAHIQFLKCFGKRWKINLERVECVQKIFFDPSKKHITMYDYETLYNTEQLKVCWKQMFRQKYLFRHLMLSRARIPQRIQYNNKLSVFENAFRTGEFNRIR